jgi:hypothetical protein
LDGNINLTASATTVRFDPRALMVDTLSEEESTRVPLPIVIVDDVTFTHPPAPHNDERPGATDV